MESDKFKKMLEKRGIPEKEFLGNLPLLPCDCGVGEYLPEEYIKRLKSMLEIMISHKKLDDNWSSAYREFYEMIENDYYEDIRKNESK